MVSFSKKHGETIDGHGAHKQNTARARLRPHLLSAKPVFSPVPSAVGHANDWEVKAPIHGSDNGTEFLEYTKGVSGGNVYLKQQGGATKGSV